MRNEMLGEDEYHGRVSNVSCCCHITMQVPALCARLQSPSSWCRSRCTIQWPPIGAACIIIMLYCILIAAHLMAIDHAVGDVGMAQQQVAVVDCVFPDLQCHQNRWIKDTPDSICHRRNENDLLFEHTWVCAVSMVSLAVGMGGRVVRSIYAPVNSVKESIEVRK